MVTALGAAATRLPSQGMRNGLLTAEKFSSRWIPLYKSLPEPKIERTLRAKGRNAIKGNFLLKTIRSPVKTLSAMTNVNDSA